jgi:DnaJ-class molecular chaperone
MEDDNVTYEACYHCNGTGESVNENYCLACGGTGECIIILNEEDE